MVKRKDKVVFKIFDTSEGREKKAHNCNICQIYKMEMKKGNTDALEFYKAHLTDWMKRNRGITVSFDTSQAGIPLALAKEL